MKSKKIKMLISVVLIVALCFSIYASTAYAISAPIVIGGGALAVGGLAWAIATAMGVQFDFSDFTGTTIGGIFDPFYNVSTTLQTSDITFLKGLRSGYDALRLSLTAYNAIKAGSVNIIEEEAIEDYSSGAVEYNAIFDVPIGIPFTYVNLGESIVTPDGGIISSDPSSVRYPITGYSSSTSQYFINDWSTGSWFQSYYPIAVKYDYSENQIYMFTKFATSDTWQLRGGYARNITPQTISFDYNAGEINIDYGEDAVDNVTIVFPQNSVLTPTSDLDTILQYINSQAQQGNLDVEIDVVPPEPLPSDPLGDVPFDQFVDLYGGSVFETIDNQTQVIDTYGQSVVEGLENVEEAVDVVGQSLVTELENQTTIIDTIGQRVQSIAGSLTTGFQNVVTGIGTATNSIVNAIDNVFDAVSEFAEDVVLGTETLISGILNQIPIAFNVIFSPIKQASTIWHYVVEWIQSITGPLNFILTMANGTSYYIVLPVYASLAAAVVLAFFKRFGR